jgi:hypothetical protein
MWQINALVVLLHNLEVKRPSGRARIRREVFIKIDLKGNGWGKWATITFLVIVTSGGLL